MFEPIPPERHLNYKVIKTELDNIIEYFINKTEREFPLKKLKHGRELFAGFVKMAKNTYNSILYLCAEKPVDHYRKPEYMFSSLPLVRTILEQVYSMAYMSEDLANRSMLFHRAGWREMKIDYDKFFQRYASDPDQTAWLASLKKLVDEGIADLQIASADAQDPKKIPRWPLPSEMARQTRSTTLKNLFQYLHDWFYKPLSQSVHVTWLLGSNLDIGQISSPWGLLTFFISKNSIQAKPSVSSEPLVPPRSSTGLMFAQFLISHSATSKTTNAKRYKICRADFVTLKAGVGI